MTGTNRPSIAVRDEHDRAAGCELGDPFGDQFGDPWPERWRGPGDVEQGGHHDGGAVRGEAVGDRSPRGGADGRAVYENKGGVHDAHVPGKLGLSPGGHVTPSAKTGG
nr:hypothetical protein GCM10020092_044890 [Actinoplanes digitatis]